MTASPTAAPIPSSVPTRVACAPAWKDRPAWSTPTSSVIHASSAPLLNVQAKPMKAAAARTSQTPPGETRGDEPEAEPGHSRDDGDPPAVGVRDDAGRNLEREVRDLQRRPRQHERERAEVEVLHEEDRRNSPADRESEGLDSLVGDPRPMRGRPAHLLPRDEDHEVVVRRRRSVRESAADLDVCEAGSARASARARG